MRNPIKMSTRDSFAVSVPSGSNVNPHPQPPPTNQPPGGGGAGGGSVSSVPMCGLGRIQGYVQAMSFDVGVFTAIDYFSIPYLVGDSITWMAHTNNSGEEMGVRLRLYNQFNGTYHLSPSTYVVTDDPPKTIRYDWKISDYFPVGQFIDLMVVVEVVYYGYSIETINSLFVYVNNAGFTGASNPPKVTIADTTRLWNPA